ncbi:radical SAM family heme chaperone HemW [Candidatus Albibeggiatoa sp. nov. NOAA]|uniref:radical SAM family heme chaperone HemW n=1 Tax=Candidatus Albibeggiatoa sp. nov. NOAA TaxID=3162724 RepID=UPI0032FDFCEC|nr:radical SAM family heme chaperone HemW [Thiotrichaceae bacterium]
MPPLSLYIHIPWCVQKCPYCDFNSHAVQHNTVPEQAYIRALLADLEQDLPKIWGRKIISIFIGGGTPSLFSPESIDLLLMELRARLNILPQAEITLEANVGTVDNAHIEGFKQAGINRLSLGVQSFDEHQLKILGRIHNGEQAAHALSLAQQHFEQFNIDLMFGLPQQTVDMALQDLYAALQFKPPHLSWYQLTLEPNTWFYHHPPDVPTDDETWEIQQAGQKLLAQYGYENYEISGYAQKGQRCKHNLNYWQFGDYLGIGAGAHGKISDAAQNTITRMSKQRHPQMYLDTAHTPEVIVQQTQLDTDDIQLEFMLNALRLKQGFTISDFESHTGLEFSAVSHSIAQACQNNWLIQQGEQIYPTALGQQFLNDVLALFMPDSD